MQLADPLVEMFDGLPYIIEFTLPDKKRPASQRDDRANIRLYILPELRHRKVSEVSFADIDGLHRKITRAGKSIAANRVMALCSKMFALAVRWKMRPDNPVRGIERNPETKRTRYLSGDELGRLTAVLATLEDQQAANIIRLLLLTGARMRASLAQRWVRGVPGHAADRTCRPQ
jgi:integrase